MTFPCCLPVHRRTVKESCVALGTNCSSFLTSRFNTHTNSNFKMQFKKNDRACCVLNSPVYMEDCTSPTQKRLIPDGGFVGRNQQKYELSLNTQNRFRKQRRFSLSSLINQYFTGWRAEVLKKLGSNRRILSHSYRIGVPMAFPLKFG